MLPDADYFPLTVALGPGDLGTWGPGDLGTWGRMHCPASRSPLSLSSGCIYWLTNSYVRIGALEQSPWQNCSRYTGCDGQCL
jgi:hypothetical protein